jgi:hypothetical protein
MNTLYKEIERLWTAHAVRGRARRCAGWLKKWTAEKAKGLRRRGQGTNLGARRSTFRFETDAKLWPDKCILHHNNAPAYNVLRVREFLLEESVTIMVHSPCSHVLVACNFWLFPEFKKCPGRAEICWHSWHSVQSDVTERYSRKGFSGLFLAVAPSSHKVRSFTRRVLIILFFPIPLKLLLYFRNECGQIGSCGTQHLYNYVYW